MLSFMPAFRMNYLVQAIGVSAAFIVTPVAYGQSSAHYVATSVRAQPTSDVRNAEHNRLTEANVDPVVAAIRAYRTGEAPRIVSVAGVLVHPFGHGLPELRCAPLRACVIELEPGEHITGEPAAGDRVRWIIDSSKAGPDGNTTLIVVKPKDCNISTNLVIPTDRRIYDLDLDAPSCGRGASTNPKPEYTRHIRFYYPDAPVDATSTSVAEQTSATVGWNSAYRIKRDRRGLFGLFGHKPVDFPWQPSRIADDGAHVYIALPATATQYASPVLYAIEDDGSRTIVNYAVRRDGYVTDRIFHRGILVLTSGFREQRLEFENRAWGHRRSSKEVH